MSEETETAQPAAPQQVNYEDGVRQALENRGVKPKCFRCPSIGWATFILHQSPSITLTMAGEQIATALFICIKCGEKWEPVLGVLGLTVGRQESRIITPEQIRQQQKPTSLVIP